MKLPCYLVQDLYKDHVCDEQTSADVAEHLSGCAECSALLAEMDAPPQETAVQEEQAAEAAEALSTVKKDLRARQAKIALAAVGGLLALICAFFGWRYWMMHSYVDLPAGDIDVEYRNGNSNWISLQHKDTGVYYTSSGFVTKYYKGVPISFISVTQTRWDVLMQKLSLQNDPVWFYEPNISDFFVSKETYEALCAEEGRIYIDPDQLIEILGSDDSLRLHTIKFTREYTLYSTSVDSNPVAFYHYSTTDEDYEAFSGKVYELLQKASDYNESNS